MHFLSSSFNSRLPTTPHLPRQRALHQPSPVPTPLHKLRQAFKRVHLPRRLLPTTRLPAPQLHKPKRSPQKLPPLRLCTRPPPRRQSASTALRLALLPLRQRPPKLNGRALPPKQLAPLLRARAPRLRIALHRRQPSAGA
jgi:hypothetical protein